MKYVGSKRRFAKYILPIVLKDRKEHQVYVEPFVGGFNMIDKVTGKRVANDSNKYLISLYDAVINNGWIPPSDISEEEYRDIRINKDNYPDYLVGFVGFGSSFSGKFFGGYARSRKGKARNHTLESKNNILKQVKFLKDITLLNKSYNELVFESESIIYCDPPYFKKTGYKDKINHDEFWDWCRDIKKKGHSIFISEYDAPPDFICLWEMKTKRTLDIVSKYENIVTEKLFTI